MRAVAIALALLVVGFMVNATFLFYNPDYRARLQEVLGKEKTSGELSVSKVQSEQESSLDGIEGQGLDTESARELEKTLSRLADGLQALSGATDISGKAPPAVLGGAVSDGNIIQTGSGLSQSGSTTQSNQPGAQEGVNQVKKNLDLPLFLQAKLYPEYSFKKFDSKAPFGLNVFSNMEFATYRDTARNVRIYVFNDSYSTVINNFKLATNVYTVKEVDLFYERTFFLNSKKNDGMIRFVILEKTGVYGLEMPKGQYNKIKNYLLSK